MTIPYLLPSSTTVVRLVLTQEVVGSSPTLATMKKFWFLLLIALVLVACGPPKDTSEAVREAVVTITVETPSLLQGLAVLSDKTLLVSEYGAMEVIHDGEVCTLVWINRYEGFGFNVICP